MRKFLKIILIVLALPLAGYSGWRYYNNHYYQTEKLDKPVAFRYMRYACGDCYPQWKLVSPGSAAVKFSNNDVYITYKGSKLEDILTQKEEACLICMEFFVTGVLKKTMSGKYKVEADKYYFTQRKNCCD
jgi:hypothetical protein